MSYVQTDKNKEREREPATMCGALYTVHEHEHAM